MPVLLPLALPDHKLESDFKIMAIKSVSSEFKPGFTLGCNGHIPAPADRISMGIPQMHALMTVLIGERDFNGHVMEELLGLAFALSRSIHEAQEELSFERLAKFNSEQAKAA